MEWLIPFSSLYLNNPILFLMVIPILGVLIWQLRRNATAESIRYNGLDYLFSNSLPSAMDRVWHRTLLLLLLIMILGVAWTAPEIRTNRPLLFGSSKELGPTFLVAFDVSSSMTEPLGGYVIDGSLNIDGITRFEAARAQLYSFIDRFSMARFGLILFSVRPLMIRLPSVNEYKFRDILDEGLLFTNPSRQRPSQLARFAGGTNTIEGLKIAGNALMDQQATSKSLLLIGDLIDNAAEIIEGMREVNLDDVYLHIMAIDPEPNNLEMLMAEFDNYENVYVYPVLTPDELSDAFLEMESIENERIHQINGKGYLLDIRWLICLLGFFICAITIFLFETRLHKTYR